MSKTLLISGGAGFLGSHLYGAYLAKGLLDWSLSSNLVDELLGTTGYFKEHIEPQLSAEGKK